MCDQEHTGQSLTAAEFYTRKINELIKDNWQITQGEIAANFGTAPEYLGHIIDAL